VRRPVARSAPYRALVITAGALALATVAAAYAPASAQASGPPALGTIFIANGSDAPAVLEYSPGSSGNATPSSEITGSGTGLNQDEALAINIAGDVFVANEGSDSVEEFGPGTSGNATPIATISGSDTGLVNPAGIALTAAGDIYVANAVSDDEIGTIVEFAPGADGNATPINTLSVPEADFATPVNGLAFNSAGDLFVSSQANDLIYEFAPGASGSANPIAEIDSSAFDGPTDVAIDPSGDLWVANSYGGNILEFAPGANGPANPINTISGSNTQLVRPYGLTFDGSGNLWVADQFGESVLEFAPGATGNATPTTDITGGSTELDGPASIAIAQPGPPAKLAFVTEPRGAVAGHPLGQQPAVAVEDAAGNIVQDNMSQVTLSITSGTGATGAALTCNAPSAHQAPRTSCTPPTAP
jgi:sugar lactone lactonase YvrE